MPGNNLLNTASANQPPNSKIEQRNKLQSHLIEVHAKYKNATYIIGGDLNLTHVDWVEETVATSKNYSTNDNNPVQYFLTC